MDKAVITECYVDSNLIETIVPTKTGYNKQHGCNNVVKLMQGKLIDSFALGIVDKDKRDLDYLNEFNKVDEITGYIILWKHNVKHHYIIQIVPEVEPWLKRIVDDLNLNFGDYDLPNELDNLYKYAKTQTSKADPNFKKLFLAISGKKHDCIERLKHWVKYLKEKNYKAEIQQLKNV